MNSLGWPCLDLGTAFGEQFLWAEGRSGAVADDSGADPARSSDVDRTVARAVEFGKTGHRTDRRGPPGTLGAVQQGSGGAVGCGIQGHDVDESRGSRLTT